jgi:hypothetical protein
LGFFLLIRYRQGNLSASLWLLIIEALATCLILKGSIKDADEYHRDSAGEGRDKQMLQPKNSQILADR